MAGSKWWRLFAALMPVVAGAVDLNPMDGQRLFTLDFQQGYQAERPLGLKPAAQAGGSVVESNGFHHETLSLKAGGELTYPLRLGAAHDAWTLWFWCRTEVIQPNVRLLAVRNADTELAVEFDAHSQPALAVRRAGAPLGTIESRRHVGGEDWVMYAVRQVTTEGQAALEFLVNGAVCGRLDLPAPLFTAPAGELVIGQATAASDDKIWQYDNLYVYAAPIPPDVLLTHFQDEMRAAHDLWAAAAAPAAAAAASESFIYTMTDDGNALRNGGFELGLKGWWMPPAAARRAMLDTNAPAAHGAASLRFAGEAESVSHYIVAQPGGGEFVLAFQARASVTNAKLTATVGPLAIFPPDQAKPITRKLTVRPGLEFTRHELAGKMPADNQGLAIGFTVDLPAGAELWLDAVQLTRAPAPGYTPAQAAIVVTTDRPLHNFFADEPVSLQLARDAGTRVSAAAPVRLEIFDVRGDRVSESDVTAALSNDTTAVLPVADLPMGALRAVLTQAGAVVDEQVFSRIPRPLTAGVDHASRYGGHYNSYPENLLLAQTIGSHWNRNHDAGPYVARWGRKNYDGTNYPASPTKGNFNYRADLFVLNHAYGQELIATHWSPWKDVDLAEYGREIYELVRGYQGHLKYLEFYNEPTSVIPPERYAELMKVAYAQAKAADSNLVFLGLSTWDVVERFTRTVVEQGGGAAMDAFAAHFYNWGMNAWLIPDGNWGQGFRFRKLRQYLDAQGCAALPIWHTESGIYVDSFYRHHPWRHLVTRYTRARSYRHHPAAIGAAWVAQAFPLNFANGVAVYTYYFMPLSSSPTAMGGHYFAELDGSLKPMAVAYAVSAHHLDHARFVAGIDGGLYGVRCYEFERDGQPLVVAWHQGRAPLYLDVDSVGYVDMMGNQREFARGQPVGPRRALVLDQAAHTDVPASESRLFLDLEPRYFPGLTLDRFRTYLGESAP